MKSILYYSSYRICAWRGTCTQLTLVNRTYGKQKLVFFVFGIGEVASLMKIEDYTFYQTQADFEKPYLGFWFFYCLLVFSTCTCQRRHIVDELYRTLLFYTPLFWCWCWKIIGWVPPKLKFFLCTFAVVFKDLLLSCSCLFL